MNCKPLLDKLHKYQITNDLTDKIFNMNCITYALQQSGKFDQKTIDNIKVSSYARYVSHKDLDKLGEQFNIAFKVVKPRDDNGKIDNITPGKKIIGSLNSDAILIQLALIDKHYILNEVVQDVTAYALKNYKQIKQDCPNKPEEWILKVYRRRGNTYEICSRDAHIKRAMKFCSGNFAQKFLHIKNNCFVFCFGSNQRI